MNALDWLLLAVLGYSTIVAFMRGLVRELFGLAGLVVGIPLAAWKYSILAAKLRWLISAAPLADAIAFLLIAVSVMIIASLSGKLIRSTADAVGLGFFDRIGGAGFGLIRGCLMGVAILMAAAAFFPQSNSFKNSQLAPYFLSGAHAVSFVVPHDLRQRILDGATELKHNSPDWIKPHH